MFLFPLLVEFDEFFKILILFVEEGRESAVGALVLYFFDVGHAQVALASVAGDWIFDSLEADDAVVLALVFDTLRTKRFLHQLEPLRYSKLIILFTSFKTI